MLTFLKKKKKRVGKKDTWREVFICNTNGEHRKGSSYGLAK
jgi:hypothetical protein